LTDNSADSYRELLGTCPDCSGALATSDGYIVCLDCGLVVSREYVNPSYQMGQQKSDDSPDAAMYVSLGNRMHIVDGLGSYIGFHRDKYFRDSKGSALSGKIQKKFQRLKSVYSTRIRIGDDEAKYRALRTLNRVSKLLMISEQVRNRTAYLYKKLVNEAEDKMTNNIILIAVCLLMAVREFKEEAPITLEEIAETFDKCGHRVSVRTIVREAINLRSATGYVPRIRKPREYVPRILSMLMNKSEVVERVQSRDWELKEYENKLREILMKILRGFPSSRRGGRNPFIFAVSAAYAADRVISIKAGKQSVLTQKLTSEATDVAEYSIRDHFGVIKKCIRITSQ
jgi:transcription initiation factor TFIIIB Brf1 subunit/transcription initiation factor TFIIB